MASLGPPSMSVVGPTVLDIENTIDDAAVRRRRAGNLTMIVQPYARPHSSRPEARADVARTLAWRIEGLGSSGAAEPSDGKGARWTSVSPT
jgi:hypothetical protein